MAKKKYPLSNKSFIYLSEKYSQVIIHIFKCFYKMKTKYKAPYKDGLKTTQIYNFLHGKTFKSKKNGKIKKVISNSEQMNVVLWIMFANGCFKFHQNYNAKIWTLNQKGKKHLEIIMKKINS